MRYKISNQSQQQVPVRMYSTRHCPYCVRARALLDSKKVTYEDLQVDGRPRLRQEMVEKSRRYTVPQIWVGDTHVGGCTELYQWERAGDLDKRLVGQS